MIKSALKSIFDDFSGSVFYWLTFVLTSMFMFLFFHLSYSDVAGVTFINSKNNMTTFMSVIVIAMCMIVIFFANDFYVKKKSKELSVQLICGATFLQITRFLLFQTLILFMIAIPIGMVMGSFSIPLVNYILVDLLNSEMSIEFNITALLSTLIILSVEILWLTVLNLGFSYRSSIKELMMNDKGQYKTAFRFPVYFEGEWKKWVYLCMFIIPIILFYFCKEETSAIFLLSIVGMVGLYGCFKNVFIPFLNYIIEIRFINEPLKVVYLGLLRSDLSLMKSNIILLVVSAIILVSILVSSLKEPIDVMLAMISFIVINILLSLAVMFKFSTELTSRKKMYHSLDRIGYLKSDLKKIMRKEVILLYGTIALLSLFYILNIFNVLFINRLLDGTLLLGMIVAFIVPLMFCSVMNYIYYAKVLMKER